MKAKFNDKVEFFNLNGMSCIGNFINGSFIGVDEEEEELLRYIKKEERIPDTLSDKGKELIDALEDGDFFNKEITGDELNSCYIHVTNRCNLNCVGCYSFDCTRNTIDDLSLDDIKDIMNQLRKAGVEVVTISGGEPLFRKDIVDILRHGKEVCGFETINLISNGTVRNEKLFLDIKKYVDDIAISIDGYDEEHSKFIRDDGIFPRVIGTIEMLRDLGLNVVILPTLHKKNIEHMSKYFELAKKLNVAISYSLMTCSPELDEYMPSIDQLVKLSSCFNGSNEYLTLDADKDKCEISVRKNCGAGINTISVAADGNIYPCHMMHDPKLLMGNIRETSLNEIMRNAKPIPIVDEVHQCKECGYKEVCGGGCRARAFLVKNDINDPDPYCEMFKNFYDDYIDRLEKMI